MAHILTPEILEAAGFQLQPNRPWWQSEDREGLSLTLLVPHDGDSLIMRWNGVHQDDDFGADPDAEVDTNGFCFVGRLRNVADFHLLLWQVGWVSQAPV